MELWEDFFVWKRGLTEHSIMKLSHALVVSTTLLSGSAVAQTVGVGIDFTPDQERTVYSTITRERVRTAPPAGFSVSVGATVPQEVELYEVPSAVEYAPAREYRYTTYQDRVYLVEPKTRKVVRIIERR
jgi:hypothetical protein